MNLSWLDLANELTPEVQTVLHYFCKDTTERILRNIARMNIGNTGALQSSIHTTLHVNSGGNDALIRFYYMNYARFLEYALGRYIAVDADLDAKQGVKARNVDVPAIGGSGYGPIETEISGLPKRKFKGKSREEYHRAKPFLSSEIRLHLKGTQKRLAMLFGYTATAYMTRGLISTFDGLGKAMDKEESWMRFCGYLRHVERDWGLSSFSAENLRV